jgi:hypothetical protein
MEERLLIRFEVPFEPPVAEDCSSKKAGSYNLLCQFMKVARYSAADV